MNILAIDGWLDFPVLQTQLIPRVKLPPNYHIKYLAWNDPMYDGPGVWDIIVGHSLGGNRALELAARLKPKACLTLDPRWMSNLSWLDVGFAFQKDFTAEPGVNCVNFTHLPPILFPGYKVDGGANYTVYSTHFTICGHPDVVASLQRIVNNFPGGVSSAF